MHNLNRKFLTFQYRVSELSEFEIKFKILQQEVEALKLTNLKTVNLLNISDIKLETQAQIHSAELKILETEITFLKERRKNKWIAYLLGFTIGATTVIVFN